MGQYRKLEKAEFDEEKYEKRKSKDSGIGPESRTQELEN